MAWITGNRYLNMAEMQNNADLIAEYFTGKGWTIQAICGMLGNMQTESTLNPGIWQNLTPGTGGYGLVQWTPYTKYSNWAGAGWENNGPKECERIQWELENGEQWIATSMYPMSFREFSQSYSPPDILADAFLRNYERPAEIPQPSRGTQALAWFEYFGGKPPVIKGQLPIYIYFKLSEEGRRFV